MCPLFSLCVLGTSINLLNYEWELLKEYVEVLEAVNDTIETLKNFTDAQFPTLSSYFPLLKGLMKSINPASGECDLAIGIENEIKKYLIEINKINVLKISMILDPRFKDRFMTPDVNKEALI